MQNKSIKLTQSQIKALQNGATMLMFPIDDRRIEKLYCQGFIMGILYFSTNKADKPLELLNNIKQSVAISPPLITKDKDVFVKEEFRLYTETQIDYKADTPNINLSWEESSRMTKEQSRFSLDCIDVRVVSVQDIDICDAEDLGISTDGAISRDDLNESQKTNSNPYHLPMYAECPFEPIDDRISLFYNQQMQEQNINRTYKDNDYVFLVEVKVNKCR